MYLFTFIPLIWRLEDLCLTLWFCLKEQRMNGIVLALFIYGLFFFYLWIYGLFWLPCSGVKEKVRNVVIGLVLEGKWDLLPLPDPVIFFFFEIHKRICENLLPCSVYQEAKHFWVDGAKLCSSSTYLHNPQILHTDSYLFHVFEQKHLLTSQWKETTQWIEKWF